MADVIIKSLILLSLTIAALLYPYIDSFAEEKRIGVVGAANPKITTAHYKKSEASPVVLGDNIYANDRIVSDSRGNAQIIFVDKSVLTIGPNTNIVIDKFVYDPDKSVGTMILNSTKGVFRFVGGALSKKKAVKFRTPVGTIGIRGGDCPYRNITKRCNKCDFHLWQGDDSAKPGRGYPENNQSRL